ncbi:N-acyl homoserine lactonase AttM, partial [Cytospora mali]
MADPSRSVRPSSPPALEIPASSETVDVRVIDTNTRLYLKPGVFWEPAIRGHDGLYAPVYCFLASRGNRHMLFDLGVRTDWENLPPKVVQLVKATSEVTGCDRGIASVLDDNDNRLRIRSSDIEAIVWSHSHFDHMGDPSRFPPATELVVGPGYPTDPDGSVLDSAAAGRTVREISFAAGTGTGTGGGPLRVGRFDAYDYFGDGSFYLLDAPGHATGHMCGLARTTADPPSFVFMGADACHHPGVLRPSRYLPLPGPAPPP